MSRGLKELLNDVGAQASTEDTQVMSDNRVREILREWWPTAAAALRTSLTAEVRDALQRHQPSVAAGSSSSSSDSSSSSSAPSAAPSGQPQQASEPAQPASSRLDSVVNLDSGMRHRVLIGPPSIPTSSWVSYCGWRFGRFGRVGQPTSSDRICQKCLRMVAGGESTATSAMSRAPSADT